MTMPGKVQTIELNSMLAKTVVSAVVETFTSMTGLTPKPGPVELSKEVNIHSDISGIITMVQEQTDGVMVVSFPKETIFHILARIYQQNFLDLNSSVQQGVAEFSNIIYCQIKTNLNKSGFNLRMALPNVVIGDQHKVVNSSHGPALVVPFTISNYTFHVILQSTSTQTK